MCHSDYNSDDFLITTLLFIDRSNEIENSQFCLVKIYFFYSNPPWFSKNMGTFFMYILVYLEEKYLREISIPPLSQGDGNWVRDAWPCVVGLLNPLRVYGCHTWRKALDDPHLLVTIFPYIPLLYVLLY